MSIVLRTAVVSDVGRLRTGNEDAAVAGPRLAAVADGMGGHADGEVASAIAIAVLRTLERRTERPDLVAALTANLDDVNAALRKAIAQGKGEQGMGTTITALLTDGEVLALAHVGDSRGYRLRDGALEQITKDQTFVQMLIDAGKLKPEEARHHPRRSVVLQAMTGEGDIEPQAEIIETQLGDRWMICSDGLSDVVDFSEIAASLQIPDRQQAAQRLVDLALAAGAPDNVTVVVADVEADGDLEELPSIAGAAVNVPSLNDTSPTPVLVQGSQPRRMVSSRLRMPILARVWVVPVVTVLVLGVLFSAAAFFVNRQFYLGVKDGRIAVFHGVSQLSRVDQSTSVSITSLQASRQNAFTEHQISGSHERVMTRLREEMAIVCEDELAALANATPTPDPSGSPSPGTGSSTSPSTSASPHPSASASPAPSPSPSAATNVPSDLGNACQIADSADQ